MIHGILLVQRTYLTVLKLNKKDAMDSYHPQQIRYKQNINVFIFITTSDKIDHQNFKLLSLVYVVGFSL